MSTAAKKTTTDEATEEVKPVEEKVYVEPEGPKPEEDIERLLPDPLAPFALESGSLVTTKPLKLREFLGLLKIVTRGAAMAMGSVRLNTDDDDFMQSMVSLFLFAIPEAEEEACDFIRMMVEPAGDFTTKEARAKAEEALYDELDNPDLNDIITIIETVVRREGKDLRSLGKRLSTMMEFAQKTGQI
jgi:hypothetical protein